MLPTQGGASFESIRIQAQLARRVEPVPETAIGSRLNLKSIEPAPLNLLILALALLLIGMRHTSKQGR